jgi:hypothetical protein
VQGDGNTAGAQEEEGQGEARHVVGKEQSQDAQGFGPTAGGRRGCRAHKVQRAFK